MPQAHEIVIQFDGQHAIPSSTVLGMNLDDTVRYSCDKGEVKIVFVNKNKNSPQPGSPFSVVGDPVLGDGVNTVTQQGKFECHCFVRPPNATEFKGWDKATSPQSGGEHNVPPNHP
jgi:hypothetical protein